MDRLERDVAFPSVMLGSEASLPDPRLLVLVIEALVRPTSKPGTLISFEGIQGDW